MAVDYSVSTDELFFRIVSNVYFPGFDCTTNNNNTGIWDIDKWHSIVFCISTLLRALDLHIPHGIVKDLICTEMRIRGILIFDAGMYNSLKRNVRLRREPKNHAEFLRAFNTVMGDDLAEHTVNHNAPAISWHPPPSYHAIRWSQRRRYIKSVNSWCKMKIWYVDHTLSENKIGEQACHGIPGQYI
jgi:hypothetical protein